MDGRAELDRYAGIAEQNCLSNPEGQGEFFESPPVHNLLETLAAPTLEPTSSCALGTSGCSVNRTASTNFFLASCVSKLDSGNQTQFFESCLKAQENERLKLGRELHDSTGQLLLALRLEIGRLREVHGTSAEGNLLDEIDETVREIDREIRSFAFTHYPAEIGRDGLGPALRSLARGFAGRTGLRIRYSSIPDTISQTGEAALAILRIAQEALLNVHKHAQALHVQMALALREGMLELAIRDDGVGIPQDHDLEECHGVGLLGMRHRVERLGGRFAIKRLKQGTKIVASVPA